MPNENKTKKIKIKRMNTKTKNNASPKKSVNKKKNKNLYFKLFKIFLFTSIALIIIGTGVVLGILNGIIGGTDSVSTDDLKLLKLTTVIYDSDGNEIGKLFDDENRVVVDYNTLPKYLIDAVVAIEDERFWIHNGIDIKRTMAAIVTYVINGGSSSFGGSTITQQLVKTITSDKEKNWTRKVREWYRAINLESNLDKESILESYLNAIYLGEGSYGMEVASQTFFAKSAKNVNLAESACLAAMIRSPEGTNVYNGERNKEKLIARQKVVLNKMLELEKITQQEYDEALEYKLIFKKSKIDTIGSVQSYFVDAVLEAVIADLKESKGITRQAALKLLYSNGYKIYSTMDPKVQKAINDTYNNDKLFYKDKAGKFMQSAMVVIDHKNGNVVGLIGGANKKKGAFEFNRATQATRQPGSTFKIIGAYGPAFEQGVSYPGKGVDDSYLKIGSWVPRNYYGYYNGYVTARKAIALSMNIPAIRTCQLVSLDYSYQFAQNLGISTLVQSDKNLASLAIGGLTKGATIMDMATAYSTIANGGIYIKPKLYTKVLDNNDKEVLIPNTEYKRVMKETTAYLLTDCLKSVVTSGTGTSTKISNKIQSAGKTGNTNDDYDQWFVGYSPYYTVACWNGYDQNKTIGTRKTGSYPYTCMKLYTTVMKSIHKGLDAASFKKPDGIVNATICTVSGLVATDACKADTRSGIIKTEMFAAGTVPTESCNIHKVAEICPVSGKLATEYCSLYNELVSKSFITRNNKNKTSDEKLLLPTEYCTVHTAAPVVVEPEEPEKEEIIEQDPLIPPSNTVEDESNGAGGGIWKDIYTDITNSVIH